MGNIIVPGATDPRTDPDNIRAFDALMRTSFSFFTRRVFMELNPGTDYQHNWHVDLMCEYLDAVMNGEIRRLLITIPPRYMKSIVVSVAFPAWVLGHDSTRQLLCASYTNDLAIKLNVDTRNVIESEWYRRAYPTVQMASDQNEKGYFRTTTGGHRKATTVGSSRIGFGGDFLIFDDPLNPKKAASKVERESANDWFDQSFFTRQNNKKTAAIIGVMQRLHEMDMVGHLVKKGGYELLSIPAVAERRTVISYGKVNVVREAGDILHPAREGPTEIEEAKITLGTAAFSAQYQQNPTPADGEIFNLKWFRYYREAPEFIRIIQSWDTAFKAEKLNDPSVCTTWGETTHGYYLLDVWRNRVIYPELKRTAMALAGKWNPSAILIEDKASGQSLIQDLNSETALPIIPIEPEGDKLTRASVVSPTVEAGRCYLPENAQWLHDFLMEMATFPNGEHDDQVDSVTQLLSWIKAPKMTYHIGSL